jgi:hypothetical protein
MKFRLAGDGKPVAHAVKTSGQHTPGDVMYYLSDYARPCVFEDGAVLMDLRTDTYLGIAAEHLPDVQRHVVNWPEGAAPSQSKPGDNSAASAQLIRELLKRGVLTTTVKPPAPLDVPEPSSTFLYLGTSDVSRHVPLKHALRFLTALASTSFRQRRRLQSRLSGIDGCQSALRHDGKVAPTESIVNPIASFFTLRPWFYTASGRCLFDSLVLIEYLTKLRVPCTLVIGVAIKPFLAHAWVQVGPSVVNDTVENVQMYKPILAIGEHG